MGSTRAAGICYGFLRLAHAAHGVAVLGARAGRQPLREHALDPGGCQVRVLASQPLPHQVDSGREQIEREAQLLLRLQRAFAHHQDCTSGVRGRPTSRPTRPRSRNAWSEVPPLTSASPWIHTNTGATTLARAR